jgi:hypothetical protein
MIDKDKGIVELKHFILLGSNNIKNISYIEITKKCMKYGGCNLAEKFLIYEKSPLLKIPQYLQLTKWEKALELSLQSYNLSDIKVIIDKITKVEEPEEFHKILSNFLQTHSAVIHYIRVLVIGIPKEFIFLYIKNNPKPTYIKKVATKK